MNSVPQQKKLTFAEGVLFVKDFVQNMEKNSIFVGVGGGSCSGKSTFSKKIVESLGFGKIFRMDSYYFGLGKVKGFNFDCPESIDFKLLEKHLKMLKENKKIRKPVYDFSIHKRIGYEIFEPDKLIIVDGLFALRDPIRKQMDLLLFMSASETTRFKRRLIRDVRERGRTFDSVIKQFNETVQPMHELYVEPTKKGAIIIENERNLNKNCNKLFGRCI